MRCFTKTQKLNSSVSIIMNKKKIEQGLIKEITPIGIDFFANLLYFVPNPVRLVVY